MMPGSHGSLPYAQVRMQARLGRRPTAPDVQRLRAASDLASCLQQVRGSPFGRHAGRLAPGMGMHEIDRRLRGEWRAMVAEVARWLPREWQPALRWLEWLPWLPALQKLARAGRAAHWMRDDPVLARVVAAAGTPTTTATVAASIELQPLLAAVTAHGDVTAAWLAHWRRLWPAGSATRRGLDTIVAAVRHAAHVMATLDTANATAESIDALRSALLRSFRRHPLAPEAAVAYLGLEALDLIELRGAITRRAALSPEAT